jgi:hypothetical protein
MEEAEAATKNDKDASDQTVTRLLEVVEGYRGQVP